jgi:hypothetical protein
MRRRVCGLCHTKFLPKRLDAEFCSNRCRQAAHRKKQVRLEADRAFKTQLQIAQNAHDAAWLFEEYRDYAASMSESAERHRLGLRFMGTPHGIIAVGDTPAVMLAVARTDWYGGDTLRGMEMTECSTKEALDAIGQQSFGASFIRMQYERECRDWLAIKQRAFLFSGDPLTCHYDELLRISGTSGGVTHRCHQRRRN